LLNSFAKKKYLSSGRIVDFSPGQLIVLSFALLILTGAILLNLPIASRNGESVGFINALFTATSATCVTGLIVVDTYTHWSIFGQIVIISLIQIGGLGFMTIATLFSFVLRRKISFKGRLVIAESLNQYNLQGIVELTHRIIIGTLIFEGIGTLLLSIRFVPEYGIANGIFKGIFHSISAFCNAGFDLMGSHGEFSNLSSYVNDPIVNLVIMSLIIIGGLGFAVWDDLYKTRSLKNLNLHTKLVLSVTGILLLFGFIFFFAAEYNNPATLKPLSMRGKLLASMFQSVSPRTAGFNTINLAGMTNSSILITMLLMFIGGSPGSTAGGIKTTTAGILVFTVISVVRGRSDTEIFKRRLNKDLVLRAFTITFLGAALVSIVTIALSIIEKVALTEALFEAISAFGTVGLTLGITPGLHTASKIIIALTMFLGRVGILTMLLALTAKAQSNKINYRYREDKVIIG